MYKLKLSDGTEFASRWCGVAQGVLTASILSDLDFLQIAEIFTDSTRTGSITFEYGEMEDVHTDYTRLILINNTTNGEYILSLRRASM